MPYSKVVGNEKEGRSGRWQMIGIGLGQRRSRFVCLWILLSSLILKYFRFRPSKAKSIGNVLTNRQNAVNCSSPRNLKGRYFLFLCAILNTACFIGRPSDSTLSEDAGIEPRIVATTADALTTRLDLILLRIRSSRVQEICWRIKDGYTCAAKKMHLAPIGNGVQICSVYYFQILLRGFFFCSPRIAY